MAHIFADYIQPLIATYGYWVVFLIVMFESAGVPLPGETALVSAAIYAGATGDLNIVWIIALAAAGAIIGDNIGFMVGRRYGLPLLRRYGHFVGLDERRIALGDVLFERHGAKIIFFGRFVAFLRIFAALLAGVHRFEWSKFLFYNAAGGIVWAMVFGIGGFLFGDAIIQLSGPLSILAFVGIVLGIIGFWWMAKYQERRFMEQAERELEERKASAPSAEPANRE